MQKQKVTARRHRRGTLVTSEETAGQLMLRREHRGLGEEAEQEQRSPVECNQGKNREKWIKEFKAPGTGTQHNLVVSSREAVTGQ